MTIVCLIASLIANAGTVLYDFETENERAAIERISRAGFSVSAEEGVGLSGSAALQLVIKPWQKGYHEWPFVTLPSPITDWRAFDRLVVEVVSEQDASIGTKLGAYLAGPNGRVDRTGLQGLLRVDFRGYRQWVIPLSSWPKTTSPSNVTRIHFYTVAKNHPKGQCFLIDRIMLLRKGERLPDAPDGEQMARRYLPLTVAGREALTEENDRLRDALAHASDYASFCRKCSISPFNSEAMAVGTASSMEKIQPRGRFTASPVPKDGLALRLARNEVESLQMVVASLDGDLQGVRIALESDLQGENGSFSMTNISCDVVGYVNVTNKPPYHIGYNRPAPTTVGYERKGKKPNQGWWPDPLLGFLRDGVTVSGMDVQSFWVRTRCPSGQRSGTYRGKIKVSADGVPPVEIPFSVRVNDFEVPRSSPLPTAITFSAEKFGIVGERLSDWADFLADYYISLDNLYHRGTEIRFDILEHLNRQGRLGLFNLGYWLYPRSTNDADVAAWREKTIPRLRRNYEEAKKRGLHQHAYIYGCDEIVEAHFPAIRLAVRELKREFPGVPLSTTAFDDKLGVGSPLEEMDWFTPMTHKFDKDKAKSSRDRGHQVWWYICCLPSHPYANMFVECQAIEGRILMGAQTIKMKPDGFLYYHTSNWKSKGFISSGPFTDWEARSWRDYNGDGSWTCAGPDGKPVATIRLENFRDGLEDYAYAKLLEKMLLSSPETKSNRKWRARAKELLDVPRELVENMRNYSDDPNMLYRWRDEMADLIEQAQRRVK